MRFWLLRSSVVLRHAELNQAGVPMDAKVKQAVVREVFRIASSACPDHRSESGHEWIQRRAMQILGAFGEPGKNNAIAKSLAVVAVDEEASVAKRCAAIDALAQLRIASADGLDVEDAKRGLATTTVQVCRIVNKRLETRYIERERNGGGFEAGGGAYGGGGDGGGYGGGGGGYGGGGYGGGGGGYGGGGLRWRRRPRWRRLR